MASSPVGMCLYWFFYQLGNFSWFFLVICWFFFKINFFEKFFQEYHQSVKQFGSRSGIWTLNCLWKSLADEISCTGKKFLKIRTKIMWTVSMKSAPGENLFDWPDLFPFETLGAIQVGENKFPYSGCSLPLQNIKNMPFQISKYLEHKFLFSQNLHFSTCLREK